MLSQLINFKKLFFLGFAVASTKVILLLFAYFFDAETYNQFNQIYYTASIIILFGSLGFNIAVTRLNITFSKIVFAITANALSAYIFLQIFSAPFDNIFQIISILIYSILISLTGILAFHLLFSGKHNDYVLIMILYSAFHLLIIPAIYFLNVDLFIALPMTAIIWFISSSTKFIKPEKFPEGSFNEFYKIGVSAFIINSAVSLALAADKYFVNHYFAIEIANSYTFAWSLTAPMFYIGVIIEQFLFSEQNTSKSNILNRGIILSSLFVVIYSAAVLVIVNFVPEILPSSISYNYVREIFMLMIAGYSVIVIFHFPINAYLFKALGIDKQKTISIIFTIIIALFVGFYILILQGVVVINYIWLLVITWSYIFTLLTAKAAVMFKGDKKEEFLKPITGITNLEP